MERPTWALHLTQVTLSLRQLGAEPHTKEVGRDEVYYHHCVPSEHSSGTKRAQGGITKTGNAHLRRVLVESAWPYRHHPFVSATLRARQRGAPADVIARAWTAQQRLHRRYQRLTARGKPNQHIVTAVARELTGFVWAALTQ